MKRILLILLFLLGLSCLVFGQAKLGLEGSWHGTLEAGETKLRLVLTITRSDAGTYAGKFESLDQDATIPIDTITLNGDDVRMEVKSAGIVFESVLNKESTELTAEPLAARSATTAETPHRRFNPRHPPPASAIMPQRHPNEILSCRTSC